MADLLVTRNASGLFSAFEMGISLSALWTRMGPQHFQALAITAVPLELALLFHESRA
jgi:hypothetical protein